MSRFRSWIAGIAVAVSIACLFSMGRPAAAKVVPGPVPVVVMTRNLYLGADLQPAINALIADPGSIPTAVGQVWAHVNATDFSIRANALAKEIDLEQPDLVGLQEVALWRLQLPSDFASAHPRPAKKVVYDFLKLLLKALKDRGLHYRPAVVQTDLDVEFPGITADGLADIRFTDRDVILARKGVAAGHPGRGIFQTLLVLPYGDGLPVPRSWVSVDAKVGGHKFRFISTHLEDGQELIQQPQLAEILAGPAATDLPVILAGDFNSDEANGYSPGVHADAVDAGLVDSWTETNPSDEGLTWGHAPLLDNTTTSFTYRLDYVFHTPGPTATASDIVGDDPAERQAGLWASDHAGLVVTLQLP
jgi:endonuclease/exonuclease/phosphatase family metal-dependent hydrolase